MSIPGSAWGTEENRPGARWPVYAGEVKGELATILSRAANHGSCMRRILKMEKEAGTPLRIPMSETAVLTILALLIRKGLKTSNA